MAEIPGRTTGPVPLAEYELLEELGSGGMGVVHRARVARPGGLCAVGEEVAVKVVHRRLLDDERSIERFRREVRIGCAVRHECVAATHGTGTGELAGAPVQFLVMELVRGQTLAELRAELGTVPEALCRHIARSVADALAAVHALGAVHRDVKPGNVLITPDERLKLTDLGIACVADALTRISRTGEFVGSVRYAAPEQFRDAGRAADPRMDLYALGVVLYELLTGENPQDGPDLPTVLRRALREEAAPLSERAPEVSPFFATVVHTLLAKDPEERFADAASLVRVLDEGSGGAWWAQAATSAPTVRRLPVTRETPLVGRDEELRTLQLAFESAASGTARIVLLEGEAGVGKSRLVDALVSSLRVREQPHAFLFGGYPPGGATAAPAPLAGAFAAHFGTGVRQAVQNYLDDLPEFADALLAAIQGGGFGGAQTLRTGEFAVAAARLLRGITEDKPVVLLVEDLHFGDDEARSLFAALAGAVRDLPVLLLGTLRPGTDTTWLANLVRQMHVSRTRLERLSDEAVRDLVTKWLASERWSIVVAERVAELSGGNPYFALELMRAMESGGTLARTDSGETTSMDSTAIAVPETVRALLAARLDALDDDERELMEVAASIGWEFDPDVLAAVLEIRRLRLLRMLGRLERSHRLIRSSGRMFCFDHHQVREHLYESLSDFARESHHSAICEVLAERFDDERPEQEPDDDAVLLLRHALRGNRDDVVRLAVGPATSRLRQTYRPDLGIELAEQVLALPGVVTGRERLMLLVVTARMCVAARVEPDRRAELLAEADALQEEFGTPRTRAITLDTRGAGALQQGDFAAVETSLLAVLELLDEHDDVVVTSGGTDETVCCALMHLGNAAYRSGRLADAGDFWTRSRARAERLGLGSFVVAMTINLANLLASSGRLEEAIDEYTRGARAADEARAPSYAFTARFNRCAALWDMGRRAESIAATETQIAEVRRLGNRQWERQALPTLVQRLTRVGAWERAHDVVNACIQLCEDVGDTFSLRTARARRLELVVDSRPADEAAAALADAAEPGALPEGGEWVLFASAARLSAREGAPQVARPYFDAVAERLTAGGAGGSLAPHRALAAALGFVPWDEVASDPGHELPTFDGRLQHAVLLAGSPLATDEHLARLRALVDHVLAHTPADCVRSSLTRDPDLVEAAALLAIEAPEE